MRSRGLAWLRLAGAALVLSAGVAGAVDDTRLQRSAALAGPQAARAMGQLLSLMDSAQALPPTAQLQAVNRFFNANVRFAPDSQVWAQEDHWASPIETLQKGAGDCEDYAIAKYFSLLAIGMPAAHLRLVYVRVQLTQGPAQAHMVLAYYGEALGDALILDNLVEDIEPASRRTDLSPVFSFNSEGLWQGVGAVAAGNPLARLSRWRDVVARARTEGFP
ncbi:MAG: transglutaminase-like cysteine peptidase [Rubrivivax sp.]